MIAARWAAHSRSFARYVAGLRRFLRTPLTGQESRRRILWQLEHRERELVGVLRDAVYERPASPYRRLLEHAGIAYDDVVELLRVHGVEATLALLHDDGVYLGLDEMKGRAAVVRGSLRFDVPPTGVDNPLLDPTHVARTGGSTGIARAVQLDFAAIEHDVPYTWLLHESFGTFDRRQILWRPLPPGSAGMNNVLAMNKLGAPIARWFTQTEPSGARELGERAFLAYTAFAIRRWGAGLGPIERVPLDEAARIARWVAETVRRGQPVFVNAPASSAVRVANAARQLGLDIAGTFFRVGGEPLTAAKAATFTDVGGRVACNYAMTEIGRVGVGCADPEATDDVHLMSGKVAVIQRAPAASTAPSDTLWFTTLHRAARKIMVNVEMGDHATMHVRSCGCAAGALGLTTHLHDVRSHEKLTTEGMNFVGSDVVQLVEVDLPARFGGSVGDYQLVETEEGERTSIAIRVSPRVGSVDDDALIEAVLADLGRGAAYKRMMTTFLRDGRSLHVERREPHVTGGGKVPPIHLRPR